LFENKNSEIFYIFFITIGQFLVSTRFLNGFGFEPQND